MSSTALTHKANHRTIRDVTKALQVQFSAAKTPLSLPPESRRLLQHFIDEHDGLSDEDAGRANQELKSFWERHVGESPQKLGAFVGVLRELRVAITSEADIWEWWQLVVKPVISSTGYKQAALDDAKEFLLGVLIIEEDQQSREASHLSKRICAELFNIYISKTRLLDDEDGFVAPDNAQVANQIESVLVAFGRRQPVDFFNSVDILVQSSSTRVQALTLLSSYLRHQAPHTYTVANTPLVASLLKCLMNDTSTTVLAVALSTLTMLLPHIPRVLGEHLPRMFLVYSRLLCWEKFSPLSSDSQRDLVTDDRVLTGAENAHDHGDVGIDPSWEKARPNGDAVEASTPELMTYFTYLYGLYPLNFLSYVRKPRKYLKNLEFPGADAFDLNQTVIRSRTDQFREVHLMHSNFYNMTIEEELIDPKWSKMDPADVVADCHALCISRPANLVSPGPPPTGKLPDLPPLPPLNVLHSSQANSRQISPVASPTSLKSGLSWREQQPARSSLPISDGDSPVLGPSNGAFDGISITNPLRPINKSGGSADMQIPSLDDFPRPGGGTIPKERSCTPQSNLAYLQREITLLRSDLNFERWHKAQYSQHIGQLARRNVKDVTAEAETLNLINANRALKQQLEHVRSARESTIKDSVLTRKQSNSLEAHLQERYRTMKREQEAWQADVAELRRLRVEMKQCRELLVASEARELTKSHELELMQRDVSELKSVQQQVREASRRLREYEYREFEFQRGKREVEILMNEKETLEMQLSRRVQEFDRTKRSYADRIAELEARAVNQRDETASRITTQRSPDTQYLMQQAIADSQAKLAQLKKAHSRLLEKHTDLELDYQSIKTQLENIQQGNVNSKARALYRDSVSHDYDFGHPKNERPSSGSASGGSNGLPPTAVDSAYDNFSEYQVHQSASDPTSPRHALPFRRGIIPSVSEATVHSAAGLTWRPVVSRAESAISQTDSSRPPVTFNQTAPLSVDGSQKGSDGSESVEGAKKKITPNSEVRVYGRGGAQNIKLKPKKKDEEKGEKEKGKGGFRGLRGIM